MTEYQVLARKYRPQTFKDVLGQDAIVATLKNAIKSNRLHHAYLFSGSRGTGKTTLARIFAKALNCQNPTLDLEPCNQCASCREITLGNSLDVIEIDGASNRGIEDIRQINETVGYATSSGKYKIYIIDEVHMLTKEAFNALLKTLEEPPEKVKFFFATTEVHKVLPTILSRCQRFNLNRISSELIVQKLKMIAEQAGVEADEEALRLVANMADGGLRDAESLFDQVLAFTNQKIDAETIASILGVMTKEIFFSLDASAKAGDIAQGFVIADRVFSNGKDIVHFVQDLTEHYRTLLLIRLSGKDAPFLALSAADRTAYEASAKLYTPEQLLTILDFLIEAEQQIRFSPSQRIALEALLMRILRIHQRIPVDVLVKRLAELEQQVGGGYPSDAAPQLEKKNLTAPPNSSQVTVKEALPPQPLKKTSITEDPTPTAADLQVSLKKAVPQPPSAPKPTASAAPAVPLTPIDPAKQSKYDTLLHFAAVELEGKIQRKSSINQ